MRWRAQGLREHLTIVTALAVAAAIAVGSLAVFVFARRQLVEQLDSTLAALAREAEPRQGPFAGEFEIVFDTGRLSGERGIAQFVPAEGTVSEPFGRLPLPDDGDGGIVDFLRPDPFLPIDDRARAVAAGAEPSYYTNAEVRGVPMRILTRQVVPGVAVQVAQPLDEINGVLSRLAWVSVGVVVAGAAVAALLGRAIAGSAVRRVGQLTSVAEDVTATRDFGRRLEVTGGDELSRLGVAFNSMLDALEASIGAQKQLVSDASHELRTPLTSIRTNVEVLARPDVPEDQRARILSDVTIQLEELSHLVGNVVELAREGERPAVVEDVAMEEVVSDVVERARRLNPNALIEVETEPWSLRGDPSRLARAVGNLVDNAVKYNANGAPVEVRARPGEVAVRDHGPGIAESDLPLVFDRFYRAASARGKPGSGLGLSIVKGVAEAHGGTVRAENAEGGGAIFTLTLPPRD